MTTLPPPRSIWERPTRLEDTGGEQANFRNLYQRRSSLGAVSVPESPTPEEQIQHQQQQDNGLAELSAMRWSTCSTDDEDAASAAPSLPSRRSPVSRTSSASSTSSFGRARRAAPARRGVTASQSAPIQASWLSTRQQPQLEMEEDYSSEQEGPVLPTSELTLTSSSTGWTAAQPEPVRKAPSRTASIGSERNSHTLVTSGELKEENDLLREQVKMLQATLREKESEKSFEDVHSNLEALEAAVCGGRTRSMTWKECGASTRATTTPPNRKTGRSKSMDHSISGILKEEEEEKGGECGPTSGDNSSHVANLAVERAIAFSMELAESRALVDSLKSELQVALQSNQELKQELQEANTKLDEELAKAKIPPPPPPPCAKCEAEKLAKELEAKHMRQAPPKRPTASSWLFFGGGYTTPTESKPEDIEEEANEQDTEEDNTPGTPPSETDQEETNDATPAAASTSSTLSFSFWQRTNNKSVSDYSPPQKKAPQRNVSTDSLYTAMTFTSGTQNSGADSSLDSGHEPSHESEDEAAPASPEPPKRAIIESC